MRAFGLQWSFRVHAQINVRVKMQIYITVSHPRRQFGNLVTIMECF